MIDRETGQAGAVKAGNVAVVIARGNDSYVVRQTNVAKFSSPSSGDKLLAFVCSISHKRKCSRLLLAEISC